MILYYKHANLYSSGSPSVNERGQLEVTHFDLSGSDQRASYKQTTEENPHNEISACTKP